MISYKGIILVSVALFIASIPNSLHAERNVELMLGADVVSRYVWRGIMINDAPNVQPSITMSIGGFQLGLWGSSTLSKTNTTDDNYAFSHEVDLSAGYCHELASGLAIGVVATDYYFPNAGIKFGNFNDYDDENGAGAHTVEAGIIFTGPEVFPINVSAYMNVYNDEGHNSYFQIDYSTKLKDIDLDFIVGAAGGSDKNADYYGTDEFDLINLSLSAHKSIEFSDSFSLPFFVTYTANPKTEINYLLCGFSL